MTHMDECSVLTGLLIDLTVDLVAPPTEASPGEIELAERIRAAVGWVMSDRAHAGSTVTRVQRDTPPHDSRT